MTPRGIGTIRQVAKWTEEDGFKVTESSIRRWVKTNTIRYVMSGNRAMIPYGPFCDFLGITQASEQSTALSS